MLFRSPFRMLVGDKLFNNQQGLMVPGHNETLLLLAVQGKINVNLFNATLDAVGNASNLAVEIYSKVYHFNGAFREDNESLEETSEDPIAKIDALFRNK